MKRMDEIMELLTDEINGFQKSIEKLEGLSKNLNEVKVKADTSNMEYHLKEHLRDQERVRSQNQRTLNEIDQKLKLAKLIPKWLLVLVLSIILILSMLVAYLGFWVIQSKNEITTFEKRKVEIKNQK
ncbi:DUF6730 family protein [uncultured Croceitalea sp.]|uniref:DUF6730 family protein n=1 Tax=uncultured Croceitalea sp. TaxID=1798908 RepID=UPI00374FA96E